MKKLISLSIIFLFFSNASGASFKDALAFDLKGPVKSCEISSSEVDFIFNYNYIAFYDNGKLEEIDGNEIEHATHDDNGYLTMYATPFLSGVMFYEIEYLKGKVHRYILSRDNEYNDVVVRNFIYRHNTDQISITQTGDIERDKISDNIKDSEFSFPHLADIIFPTYDDYYSIRYNYIPLTTDEHDNVTSYIVRGLLPAQKTWEPIDTIYRNITYWGENKTDSSSTPIYDIPQELYSPHNLEMKDLLSKALGVIPVEDNIWNTNIKELNEVVDKIPSWKNSVPGTFIVNLNNYKWDKTSEIKGYEMTYRGEPLSSVAAFSGSIVPNGRITQYQYIFQRNIKGKIPKNWKNRKEEYLKQPQWTERQALIFADAIAHDIYNATGITLTRQKVTGKELYVLRGIDTQNKSLYTITVFKTDNEYWAEYNVVLLISSEMTDVYKQYHM